MSLLALSFLPTNQLCSNNNMYPCGYGSQSCLLYIQVLKEFFLSINPFSRGLLFSLVKLSLSILLSLSH